MEDLDTIASSSAASPSPTPFAAQDSEESLPIAPSSSKSADAPIAPNRNAALPRRDRRNPACLACRLRKVACRGLDVEGATSCEACVLHSLPCSRAPAGAVSSGSVPREGYKRDGNTIKMLRKAADSQVSKLNLGPSSSTSRLVAFELSGSLSWTLAASAFEESSVQSAAPLMRISVACDVRNQRMRPRQLGPEEEALMACYIAMGSRRTHHSAVIGDTLEALAMSDELLGPRREAACRTLANRALALLESAPSITKQATVRNLEILTVFRDMIAFVDPSSDFSRALAEMCHRHTIELVDAGHEFSFWEGLRTNYVLYDVRTAARLGIEPFSKPSQFARYQPGAANLVQEALLCFSHPELDPPSLLHLSIWIVNLQCTALHMLYPLEQQARRCSPRTRSSFNRIWDLLDLASTYIHHKLTSPPGASCSSLPLITNSVIPASNTPAPLTRRDIEGQVPDLFLVECHVLAIALRINVSTNGSTLANQELRAARAPVPFESLADAHWAARRLDSALQVVSGWIELAIAGASQFATGGGELACVGLTWGDLQRLQASLKSAGVVFASTALWAEQLQQALKNALSDISSSQTAAKLVETVLEDLSSV